METRTKDHKRINLALQLKIFSVLAIKLHLTAKEQLLYMHLLFLFNDNFWELPAIAITDAELVARMNLYESNGKPATPQSIRRAKNTLKSYGLIKFVGRQGGKAKTKYRIVPLTAENLNTLKTIPADDWGIFLKAINSANSGAHSATPAQYPAPYPVQLNFLPNIINITEPPPVPYPVQYPENLGACFSNNDAEFSAPQNPKLQNPDYYEREARTISEKNLERLTGNSPDDNATSTSETSTENSDSFETDRSSKENFWAKEGNCGTSDTVFFENNTNSDKSVESNELNKRNTSRTADNKVTVTGTHKPNTSTSYSNNSSNRNSKHTGGADDGGSGSGETDSPAPAVVEAWTDCGGKVDNRTLDVLLDFENQLGTEKLIAAIFDSHDQCSGNFNLKFLRGYIDGGFDKPRPKKESKKNYGRTKKSTRNDNTRKQETELSKYDRDNPFALAILEKLSQ